MHLSEFAHFFSALPALHASMRDLIRLSGYWNHAHRERDATYTLATTIFGVVKEYKKYYTPLKTLYHWMSGIQNI